MVEFLKVIGVFIGGGVVLIFGHAILVNRLWWIGERYPKTATIAHGLANILYPSDDKTRENIKMIMVWLFILIVILLSDSPPPDDNEYRSYDNRGYLYP